MKFIYGKNDWKDLGRGQENCYLLTNGLGGYSSLTMIGSVVRNDHALLMSCIKAPNYRYHMITKTDETIVLKDNKITLSSQEFVNHTKNQKGFTKLQQFYLDHFPTWTYQIEGVEVKKTIIMRHGENTLGIRYEINNRMEEEIKLFVTPQLQFVPKGEVIKKDQVFHTVNDTIKSNDLTLFFQTNAVVEGYETEFIQDLYYAHDARDGRDAVGRTAHNHKLCFTVLPKKEFEGYIIYSTKRTDYSITQMLQEEENRINDLCEQSGIKDAVGLQLVESADAYLVERESTKGKTLMAGYPFFADWGRDTMISMVGCCIFTRRYEEAKSIFRSFIKYYRRGLIPNMFPEGENEPLYNTVDASLLFIIAVYEYYQESKDISFLEEAFPTMEDIIKWYQDGTDFHIRMDQDGLIMAGSGNEQVTWMDVRFGDILPTPRHGKPVEINAYWYNAIKIMGLFSRLLGLADCQYEVLADKVGKSFCDQFWNERTGCLKDVISYCEADEQIRCNQIWATSLPFTMLKPEQEKSVVDKVFEKLYTPYGLRTLNPEDKDFKANYGGSHFDRDMAYHQGTVWPFPMGAYYLAYLKVNQYSEKAVKKVREQLVVLEACMREGCIGQIAEIYDGLVPAGSQGCFAQAWSVGEILRVYAKLEKLDNGLLQNKI